MREHGSFLLNVAMSSDSWFCDKIFLSVYYKTMDKVFFRVSFSKTKKCWLNSILIGMHEEEVFWRVVESMVVFFWMLPCHLMISFDVQADFAIDFLRVFTVREVGCIFVEVYFEE